MKRARVVKLLQCSIIINCLKKAHRTSVIMLTLCSFSLIVHINRMNALRVYLQKRYANVSSIYLFSSHTRYSILSGSTFFSHRTYVTFKLKDLCYEVQLCEYVRWKVSREKKTAKANDIVNTIEYRICPCMQQN